MKNTNYICLDPSRSSSGLFLRSEKKNFVGSIKNKAGETDQECFKNIFLSFYDLVTVYEIDLIVLEENPFAGFNKSRSPSKMAEAIGIIKLAAYLANKDIEIITISNALWKGVLKGLPFINTKKNKKYIEMATKYYTRDFDNCDEVDAFSIAVAVETLYKKYGFSDAQMRLKANLTKVIEKIEARKIKKLF